MAARPRLRFLAGDCPARETLEPPLASEEKKTAAARPLGGPPLLCRTLAVLYLSGLILPALLPAADDGAGIVNPINLGNVNTAKDEDDPFPASNGLSLYYSSNAAGKFDILVAGRSAANQLWTPGKPLEDYVQTKVDDRSVFVTPEGCYPQFLYFATRKDRRINNFDLYVAVRQQPGAAFSAPTPLNTVCTEVDELHPCLSRDGKELYFSRQGVDGWRVCVASRPGNTGAAGFGEPRRLKELPPNFHHAALTPDGSALYLQGPLEKGRWGRWGLFRCDRSPAGWSAPVALEMLNHPGGPTGDRSPSLSADGSLLYFTSDRPGGKGGLDLWAVRVDQLKKAK